MYMEFAFRDSRLLFIKPPRISTNKTSLAEQNWVSSLMFKYWNIKEKLGPVLGVYVLYLHACAIAQLRNSA